jgi:hypothetical protein
MWPVRERGVFSCLRGERALLADHPCHVDCHEGCEHMGNFSGITHDRLTVTSKLEACYVCNPDF